jgi:hypothetical protein
LIATAAMPFVKAKLNCKRNDLRIAAIVLELGATIVTRNRRDFARVAGLSIEDYSTEARRRLLCDIITYRSRQ